MQVVMYLRLINMTGKALNSNGLTEDVYTIVNNTIDPGKLQFIKILNYSNDVLQTLNISAQSSGAGAGKITFNPFVFTRNTDAASSVLFQNAATGTSYKTAEVFFTNPQSSTSPNSIIFKQTYKLPAIQSVSWSAVDSDAAGIREVVAMQYASQVLTFNRINVDSTYGTPSQAGWDATKNTMDNNV